MKEVFQKEAIVARRAFRPGLNYSLSEKHFGSGRGRSGTYPSGATARVRPYPKTLSEYLYKCVTLQFVLFLGLAGLLAGCGSQVNNTAASTAVVVETTPAPSQPTPPPPTTTPTATVPATATTPPTAVPTDPATPLTEPATPVPEVTPRDVPEAAPEVHLNQPFILALGQTARLEEADLSLTFSDLLEDSRCPSQVTCVWAGQAIIRVRVQQGGAKRHRLR
jgi:hypothetical protein